MCLTPQATRTKGLVPCGRCADCIGLRRQGWNDRLFWEAKGSGMIYFVTLTYSGENLKYADESPVLYYSDLTLFFKRLRKKKLVFKYFAVGEYGERFERPHYHVLFFLTDFIDFVPFSNLIENTWGLGNVSLYPANEAMLKYCTKDMLKETFLFKDFPREFRPHILVSKGLGLNYVKLNSEWHSSEPYKRLKLLAYDNVHIMCRYFRNKIFSEQERSIQRIIAENHRRDSDLLPENLSKSEIEKLRFEAKIYSQKVEALRRRALKINHYNRKL